MNKKVIAALIVVVAIVATGSFLAGNSFKPSSTGNNVLSSLPAGNSVQPSSSTGSSSQPVLEKENVTYTGQLVSFKYVTSDTNGVNSTELYFTNKTFNYNGYISLQNDDNYNVTYFSDSPNQAQNITDLSEQTFRMQTEQVKVSNPMFTTTSGANAATIDVANSGTQSVVISKISINGVDVTATSNIGGTSLANPYTLAANQGVTINIDCSAGPAIVAGNNYQITVTTSNGNQFSYSAVDPGP